jgi:hypothetical protein
MVSSEVRPSKPAMPTSWQWVLRITGAIAILLFLTPTVYVVKYYAIDLPREQKLAHEVSNVNTGAYGFRHSSFIGCTADELPAIIWCVQNSKDPQTKEDAVAAIQTVLLQPGVGWKRPIECLLAKAALANTAAKDTNPTIRQEASSALAKVAQGGVVIRR